MKGLRRILKIPHTFIDRSYTNQKVFETLKNYFDSEVELFSSTWLKRKLKLFGHIFRTNPDDPLPQVLVEYNSYTPRIEHRRPGKPRTSCLLQSFKDAFGMLGRNQEYDYNNREHQSFVITNALNRQGIFAQWSMCQN